MKVILIAQVKGLGRDGDIVEVTPGYFQNFLAPRKLAKIANEGTIAEAAKRNSKKAIELEKSEEDAKLVFDKLNGKQLVVKHKANGNSLYAAVTEKDLIEEIFKEFKIRLKQQHFQGKLSYKTTGKHEVDLNLSAKLKAKLYLSIDAA